MLDLLNTLKDTPIPTILILAGIVFILLAIVGQIDLLKTPPLQSSWQKWAAGTVGGLFLIAGLLVYLLPISSRGNTPPSPGTPTVTAAPSPTVTAASSPSSTPISFANLDDEANRWTTIQDTVVAKPTNIQDPSVDGSALKVSLTKGHPGNSILALRNLSPADTATTFELNLSFYFLSADYIQALGFSIDKWVSHQRWEWKLQWFNFPTAGAPPSWRVFDGKSWQDTHVMQDLSANMWHTLQLKGDIVNGQVHYISFSCDVGSPDATSASLDQKIGQKTFAPIFDTGANHLSVMVELDGDTQGNPYEVYFDGINLQWG